MSRRSTQSVGAFVLFVAGCVCAPVIGHGQAPAPKVAATQAPAGKPKPWVVPRTSDGKPDLQGNWTNETQTPLERMGAGQGTTLTDQQAAAIEQRAQLVEETRDKPSDPNRAAPPEGWRRRRLLGCRRAVVHRTDLRRRGWRGRRL